MNIPLSGTKATAGKGSSPDLSYEKPRGLLSPSSPPITLRSGLISCAMRDLLCYVHNTLSTKGGLAYWGY